MKKAIALAFTTIWSLGLIHTSSWAAGNDLELPFSGYTQDEFKELSETIGLLISYKPLAPAEPLGILGFDIGLEVTVVDVDQDKSFLKKAVLDTNPPTYFFFPHLHAQKGLP